MTTLSPPRPAEAPAAAPPRAFRWHSLDVLKGIALWAMVAHHFARWTGGHVEERFLGFEYFLVTELAAPVFAVGLGAAAVVVGVRVASWADLRGPMLHWGQILLLGIAIDVATHRGQLEGRGVLPTLAVLGALVTAAAAARVRSPWTWWAVSFGCVLAAVPAVDWGGDDVVGRLVSGPFALPVYGVFAAAGAAVACHGLGRAERSLPLVRSAVGVLVVGLVAAEVAGGAVAPEGIWPPARYPGHLSFTLWGLVASLVIWAAVRRLLPAGTLLGEGAARAGRRTLLVFGAHFAVKIAFQLLDLTGELDTWRWGLVTWTAVAAVAVASAWPAPSKGGDRTTARC